MTETKQNLNMNAGANAIKEMYFLMLRLILNSWAVITSIYIKATAFLSPSLK